MAIADTLRGQLSRFNPPLEGGKRVTVSPFQRALRRGGRWVALVGVELLRWVGLLLVWAVAVGLEQAQRLVVATARATPRLIGAGLRGVVLLLVAFWRLLVACWRLLVAFWVFLPRIARPLRWGAFATAIGLLAWAAMTEMQDSHYQAVFFTRLDRGMKFVLGQGPSDAIVYPKHGPYDERLGYAGLPNFLESLGQRHFAIDSQARWSPELVRFVSNGAFPIYNEKARAGLKIYDRSGAEIYQARVPQHDYQSFAEVPPLIVNSLLFIEDRYLLDTDSAERNAAVEWNRFMLAAAGRVAGLIYPKFKFGGASTLATQIEKFRHSPSGRTEGIGEKFRQMITASARVYSQGRTTIAQRENVVLTYLNATPLSSRPGYGEVIGLPDALWVWYGTDPADANKVLNSMPRTAAEWSRKGEIYRQVLSLLLADRGPSYYLLTNRPALDGLTDKHLKLLADKGVIDEKLRDAALAAAPLKFREDMPAATPVSFVRQKATQEVRARLMSLLKLPSLYDLDRVDLVAETSIDTETQARVANVLQHLSDPAVLRERGMIGHQLLGGADPSKVTYSFVLYERGAGKNFLRVHADSLNQPFDINSGAKLQLGSTAKLRTLVTYLGIMEGLHRKFSALPAKELLAQARSAPDPLTGWAATYLASTRDRSLQPMLDAAMQRHYSASSGSFFTGGGSQSFGNFESWEDGENPTLVDAFEHSINLSFVRLLQDITTYYGTASSKQMQPLLDNPDNPDRDAYLRRFADQDGRRFLNRYWKDYRGLSPDDALALLVRRTRPVPKRLAAVFLSVHPDARFAEFRDFVNGHLPKGAGLDDAGLWKLYVEISPERMNLKDRGYVAGVHPLELWLVNYIQEHPDANRGEIMSASEPVRQEVYSWLLKGSLHKQDTRIRILMEQDAFERILQNWRAQGYPFAHLIPSLGTAIGASGDRPQALAELMGIILNDGVRQPSVDIEHLRFAADTPYDTTLSVSKQPERVMSPEVAQTLRRTLTGVVAEGTAARLKGTYTGADRTPLVVGGKTGTGDNRYDHFAPGGGIISSRVVDRTATFVFFLGDRFYGTVTAYVPGEDAAKFNFTSALAVQLLKSLEPELRPLITSPPAEASAQVASARAAEIGIAGSSQPPKAQ